MYCCCPRCPQVQREQRRVAKWRHMLGSSAADFEAYFAAKMSKVKKRVRKGIPDEFRGYVWQLLSGGGSSATALSVSVCWLWLRCDGSWWDVLVLLLDPHPVSYQTHVCCVPLCSSVHWRFCTPSHNAYV